ncbi:hypothetical protein ABGN05_04025 [Aquibium sp. LZ166]|uniref:Uncharacterized protein n=1 Tax=Aquibium pacificus TaxID=3153579 RepID=A0ABV3SEU9_9HYPH
MEYSTKFLAMIAFLSVLTTISEPAFANFTCSVQCTNASGAPAGKKTTSSVQQPQQCEPFIKKEAKKCPGGNANGDAGGYATIKIRDGKPVR